MISSSPGELEPVFEAMLANATQLCGAKFGILNLYDGEAFTNAAFHGVPEALHVRLHELIRPHPRSGLAEIARTRQVVQIEDITARLPYRELSPAAVALADLGGARTLLLVPMLKDDKLIGAIGIYRQEVKPFTDKQIELVAEFRQAGRHRHREHAAAQRAARIAAAADRHRRRAQGHQPLDFRSAGGA